MSWNLLLIIVVIAMFCGMINGYKRGMVREIIAFVSLIITCVVVVLFGNGLHSYFEGKIVNVVIAVVLLCLIGIVRHLLGVIFFSAKVISKLPVVHWLDKILGIVVGIAEIVLILWTIYTFVMFMDLGIIGQQILVLTQASPFLTWLYQHNYLAYLVETISSEISFLPL